MGVFEVSEDEMNEVSDSFELLPAGEYTLNITSVTDKPTKKDPRNICTVVEFDVIDGPHKGRKHWENFNIFHSNPQTAEWAAKDFKRMAKACGLMSTKRTEDVVGRVVIGKMVCEEDKQGNIRNRVKGYKPARAVFNTPDPTDTSGYSEPVEAPASDSPWK